MTYAKCWFALKMGPLITDLRCFGRSNESVRPHTFKSLVQGKRLNFIC